MTVAWEDTPSKAQSTSCDRHSCSTAGSPTVCILPFCTAGDSQVAVLNGLLSASGRQSMGAIINCTAYWLIGLSISCLLAFNANWGVYGLRVGLLAASVCQGLVMHLIAACRFDWDREVDRARLLVGDDGGEGSADHDASEQSELHSKNVQRESLCRVSVELHSELEPEVHPELHSRVEEVEAHSVEITGGGSVELEDSSEAAEGGMIIGQSSEPSSDCSDRAQHQPLLGLSQR